MAQNGTRSARKYRGSPSSVSRDDAVTDRIHTPMLKDKAAFAEPVIDRIHSQPERSELFAKDDAILVARQRCNPGVDGTSVTFAAHIAVNVNFVGRGHV